ncbi:hypothetical protein, partial [Bacillus cereus group sp. BfR-BA-01379]|uniref:hypothetical protein n=1 Tax=Bacillus cereus group sp. BfR-BA-01379 TaxID=2920323 RepID=UPI001F5798FD
VELKVENGKVLAKYPEITDTEERSITFKVKVKEEVKKVVNSPSPKLGEEVEYRISFKNTVESGKLTEVKIE